jgi:hypothetical protein
MASPSAELFKEITGNVVFYVTGKIKGTESIKKFIAPGTGSSGARIVICLQECLIFIPQYFIQ